MKSTKLLCTTVAILGMTVTTLAQVPANIPTNGLLGYWSFTGNANDGSGNNNHGTVNGATLSADRHQNSNSAYSFNGSGNNISLPATAFGLNTYTYSLWFNTATVPAQGTMTSILSIGNDPSDQVLGLSNDYCPVCNGIGFSSYYSTSSTDSYWQGTPVTPNAWYHLALTRTTDSLKFYINGVLVHEMQTTLPSASYGNNPFEAKVGERAGVYLQYFDGKIDDIGIWNRALTQQEVSLIFTDSVVTTSVTELNAQNRFTVYPNPVKDQLSIHIGNNLSNMTGYSLTITNILGQTQSHINIDEQLEYVDISSLASGVYLVNLQDAQHNIVETRKILVK